MEEKARFIEAWAKRSRGPGVFEELCRDFGITEPCGRKWVRRFLDEGPAGLEERSRAPHHVPHATDEDVVKALVGLKQRFPSYGPKKLVGRMRTEHPTLVPPASSTAGEILKKHGLVKPRRRRHHSRESSTQGGLFREATRANEVWAADYKGEFKLKDGTWCWPLTITDSYSRFLVRCVALPSTSTDHARPVFESAFGELGLPEMIHTDNGTPFASTSTTTLTLLSAWWVLLGVGIERSRPGRPQDNGRHERFHRTLKEATVFPPAEDMAAQQLRFDAFHDEYNNVRPHESLGQEPPANSYQPSSSRMPPATPYPEYPRHWDTRLVSTGGYISVDDVQFHVGTGLRGQVVGLEPYAYGLRKVHFAWYALGEIDDETEEFTTYGPQSRWRKDEPQS